MKRLVLGLTAFTLATAVVAGPAIGNLPKSDIDASQFCQFSINDAAGGVVLQMKYWEANIVLDSKLTKLRVEEKNCTTDCVGSGLSGVRVFQLSGSGIQAKLTKQVACAKDAEVCGGLPEGAAELRVSTSAGETVLTLWGEYCDM